MYFRFGNTAGACASLIVGTVVSAGGILMPRNWADSIYPWLERAGWQENIGAVQKAVSGPFLPYITWLTDASAWHFCSLRRPSGIPVLFSFEGTPWMSSSGSFSMRRNGSTHRLDCIDGVSHVFGGGGFEKCELRNQRRGGTAASRLRKSSNGTAADQLTGSRAKWESSDSDSSSFEKRKMRLIT